MLIRKPNSNMPIRNNQESDKVVIDGLMTAEDLTILGQEAGSKTIEQLRSLYPKNKELEEKELEIMSDDALAKKLRIAGKDNDEKINAIYQNQLLKNKIKETRSEIQRLNVEYNRTHEENLIFEKDRKIRELENELEKARQKLQ
nr:MAG TPA: hypothetical protein [Microviridae sp.]